MSEADARKQIQKYFKGIRQIYLAGDYTEWTYRTPFENFIKSLNSKYDLIQEPKREAGLGAPDFKAFYGSRKVGYIEAKDLGTNLDEILETEQIKKYVSSIDNLLLTNYTRFILIRKGAKILDYTLFPISNLDKGKFAISGEHLKRFIQLLDTFFGYNLPTITSAGELARELSKRAKLLKDLAKEQLQEDINKLEENKPPSSIYDFYLGIKELIPDISIEDCADAYAQTVTYGLFLAAKAHNGKLSIGNTAYYIPKRIGVIKRIFTNISGDEFPSIISWVIEEIIDVLNASKLNDILSKIDKRGKKDKDPMIYFYEDFLNYYEPEKRKRRGVYYTPRPIVNFIVNSVHNILKQHFDKPRGLADNSVTVLDPAVGTGTFLWIAFLVVLGELKNHGLRGMIFDKIRNHLLEHFYGFEILITPYVISHLKLTYLLQKWHYSFGEDDRIQIYLTNTLEHTKLVDYHAPFSREISEEGRAANEIKLKKPILVIMGNPPYSGRSENNNPWINDLLKSGYARADGTWDDGYYKVDGKSLDEKNPKWLQDDYVKFIRYAQWKIDQNGEGVVGFITNHSYLDNPTFRGMRESLLQSFDRIYILNLHGNALKKEKCPDGSKDENVFDIKQGVAIAIFIKNKNLKEKKVYYANLWGTREHKYNWLDRHTISNVKWQEVKPVSPYYFFIPRNTDLEEDYSKFWKVTDIFSLYGVGMTTARDNFVIDFSRDILLSRIKKFKNSVGYSDEQLHSVFGIRRKKGWDIRKAWGMLQKISDDKIEQYLLPVSYRPFDRRWIFYHDSLVWRTVKKVMQHMLKENLGLVTVRQMKASTTWAHVGITDTLIESSYISNKTSEINYLFPLCLYTDSGKNSNFSLEFLKFIKEKYGKVTPEEIFYYIYAILYSPTYRNRYGEFLKYDFPKIPFVDDYKTFKKLSELGKELVELHLMKKKLPTTVKFDIPGSNIVDYVKYDKGKVWINKEQYLDGIPESVWNFYIGSYKVLDKWLKSRKKRVLNSKEIETFLQIVEIIKETIRIMKEIDETKWIDKIKPPKREMKINN